jgi:hypothetical protein
VFNFSIINCVSVDVKVYVHPVAVLGSIFIKTSDKGMLTCLAIEDTHRMVMDDEDGEN